MELKLPLSIMVMFSSKLNVRYKREFSILNIKGGNIFRQFIYASLCKKDRELNDAYIYCAKKRHYPPVTVTTMLATSKNVLSPGYNLLLITGADDAKF